MYSVAHVQVQCSPFTCTLRCIQGHILVKFLCLSVWSFSVELDGLVWEDRGWICVYLALYK